jgi:hypothetical protein
MLFMAAREAVAPQQEWPAAAVAARQAPGPADAASAGEAMVSEGTPAYGKAPAAEPVAE